MIYMTIDEAIQRENNIAEENQKIVDTEIVFDDVSLSQLYCDDTEVIEEHLENYKKCAEYHKKIAAWLEELKAYRENSNGYNKEDIELNRNAMYNKAIDDFASKLENHSIYADIGKRDEVKMEWVSPVARIEEIAKQLKVGGKNDD